MNLGNTITLVHDRPDDTKRVRLPRAPMKAQVVRVTPFFADAITTCGKLVTVNLKGKRAGRACRTAVFDGRNWKVQS